MKSAQPKTIRFEYRVFVNTLKMELLPKIYGFRVDLVNFTAVKISDSGILKFWFLNHHFLLWDWF